MRILFYTLVFVVFSGKLYSQTDSLHSKKRDCVTVGFLQGGGSLIGADFETIVKDQLGLQMG